MKEPFEHKGVVITPEQQSLILDTWNQEGSKNPPSLNELIRAAFPDIKNADGRTKEGRAVRAFLSSTFFSSEVEPPFRYSLSA